jgi:hypothetical protein
VDLLHCQKAADGNSKFARRFWLMNSESGRLSLSDRYVHVTDAYRFFWRFQPKSRFEIIFRVVSAAVTFAIINYFRRILRPSSSLTRVSRDVVITSSRTGYWSTWSPAGWLPWFSVRRATCVIDRKTIRYITEMRCRPRRARRMFAFRASLQLFSIYPKRVAVNWQEL